MVPAGDERIADVDRLQLALANAHIAYLSLSEDHDPKEIGEFGAIGGVDLYDRDDYQVVRDALEEIPRYDGDQVRPGWYVEFEGNTYRLTIELLA